MTATEALERRIDELCRENERLRQQVASIIGRSIRTADKLDCLDAENARLRELVLDMVEWAYIDSSCDLQEQFADRMRELGVEVDA